jgi:arginine-tRNA-protein transferase
MFTICHYPTQLSEEQLDSYLADGWFRMGQTIFTCFYLDIEEGIFPTIWLRKRLADHHFKKSHRKLIKKVENNFRVEVRKAIVDDEKERLYDVHKLRFKGPVALNLYEALMDNATFNIYDTWETAIYDGDKLIAASFFDLGSTSAASIKGIFHPDYNNYSLGFYTMLKEIAFLKENHFDYYYPGYFVVDYPKFDYKLRIGSLEFLSTNDMTWVPIENMVRDQLAPVQLKNNLLNLQEILTDKGIFHEMLFFPSPTIFFQVENQEQIQSPLTIWCPKRHKKEIPLLIDYDTRDRLFRLYRISLSLDPLQATPSLHELLSHIFALRQIPRQK